MSTPPLTPRPPALDDLRRHVRGSVQAPGSPAYDVASRPYYGGFDHRPGLAVRPIDADDVATVVAHARDTGTELAVRSGGHSLSGHSTTQGGILLDLASLDGLDLDIGTRTAWVGAGSTAGAYTEAAGAHGLATGFGDAGTVGIGGLTLGGGVGFLSRKHGLTVDSLLAAEVVTADGQVRHVDADHHPELFWGIRGGGGNLGIVTRLRFALHDVREVAGGMLVLPATPEVLAGLVEVAGAAPEELTVLANTMIAPPMPLLPAHVHGRAIVMVLALHAGPATEAEAVLGPLRGLATPLVDELGPMTYPELFAEGPPGPPQPTVTTRSLFRDSFSTAEAEVALAGLRDATAPMAVVQLRVLGGAIARVPEEATAYAHRRRRLMINVAAMYQDSAERGHHTAWAGDLAARLHEDGVDGVYVNFLGPEQAHRVRDAYPGATWDRLVALKRRYDPHNVFRRNHNVPVT